MPFRKPPAATDAYRYPLHIGQIFRSALDARTTNTIVGSDGRRLDYPSFGRRVHALAHVLADLGVQSGDVVAVMDWDSHRYLECYFAVPMLGAVLQTVNVRLSPDQIAYTLGSTGARVLLFHADFAPLVALLAPRLPQLQTFVLAQDGATAGLPVDVVGEYEALVAAAPDTFPFVDVDEDAMASTFHTTGTTGLPKAVAFSHRQLVLHTLAIGTAFGTQPEGQGLRRGDVYMPITPMFHVHAWGIPLLATMLGLQQVYPGRYDPARLLALRRKENVTFSHCVPTILQMLLDAWGPEDPVDRRWTVVIGGSAMTRCLHRAAAARGIVAVTGYGMSETAPVLSVAYSIDEQGEERESALCSAGHAIPLVQLRIVDEAIRDQPVDGSSQGELVARAPWLTTGYSSDSSATERLWQGGWLHTQDVATMASSGRVQIRDRLKDVIKTGGEWVSSSEMEDLAMRDPRIAAAAFVAMPDAHWGEVPAAFIVVRPGQQVDLDSLRAHLQKFVNAGAISRHAMPVRLVVVEDLPKTSVGKLDKKAMRAGLTGIGNT